MKSILFDTAYLDNSVKSVEEIESFLTQKYGAIIRWAIVAVNDDYLKINVTYEK